MSTRSRASRKGDRSAQRRRIGRRRRSCVDRVSVAITRSSRRREVVSPVRTRRRPAYHRLVPSVEAVPRSWAESALTVLSQIGRWDRLIKKRHRVSCSSPPATPNEVDAMMRRRSASRTSTVMPSNRSLADSRHASDAGQGRSRRRSQPFRLDLDAKTLADLRMLTLPLRMNEAVRRLHDGLDFDIVIVADRARRSPRAGPRSSPARGAAGTRRRRRNLASRVAETLE